MKLTNHPSSSTSSSSSSSWIHHFNVLLPFLDSLILHHLTFNEKEPHRHPGSITSLDATLPTSTSTSTSTFTLSPTLLHNDEDKDKDDDENVDETTHSTRSVQLPDPLLHSLSILFPFPLLTTTFVYLETHHLIFLQPEHLQKASWDHHRVRPLSPFHLIWFMPRRPRTKVHKKSHPPTTLQEAVQAWNEQREGWTSVSLAPPLRPSSGPEKKEVMDSWDPWLDATVTLFPFSGYCPCSFFHSHVLSSGSTFMCPHLLAYHLLKQRTIASSSSTGLESSSVFSVDQEGWKDLCFEYLMHGQVFLESHLNHMNS